MLKQSSYSSAKLIVDKLMTSMALEMIDSCRCVVGANLALRVGSGMMQLVDNSAEGSEISRGI